MPSSVPAARRALLDMLVEGFAADQADVSFLVPSAEAEVSVVLTSYLDAALEQVVLGSDRVDETYQLQVVVIVQRPSGDDAFTVEAEALTYADRVAGMVAGDRTLGGAVRLATVSSRAGGREDSGTTAAMADGGYQTHIDVRVDCVQRI